MNEDTRARKQARLGRLRVEVAALELELAALQLSASSSDGDGDCSDDGSETSAASGSSMDIEQGGCGLDGDDKADEGDSPSDSDEDDDPLGLSGGVAAGFTGPVGGGFWGGSPPATPPAPPPDARELTTGRRRCGRRSQGAPIDRASEHAALPSMLDCSGLQLRQRPARSRLLCEGRRAVRPRRSLQLLRAAARRGVEDEQLSARWQQSAPQANVSA